jgi:hypothetical protein
MTVTAETDRRAFLRRTTGILTGIFAAGSPLALIAPSNAWAVDLAALTSEQGKALLAAARTIAPHDRLDDAAYALVVRAMDAEASTNTTSHEVLRAGIASLGAGFASAAEDARVQVLKKIEHSAFFQTLRQQTLQTLYASPLAYALFGYEGEVFSKGGYLLRGFNDLRWLPAVPEMDSGPMPAG